jgi:hypothetical protein
MANGYGGSSGSSGSSSSSSSPSSYSSGGGFSGGFLKIKDGVKAPAGFHYMPNGKLMNDADHIAVFGYIERQIKSVTMDYSDISSKGTTRNITISGEAGSVFSVEIYEGDRAKYYNFKTNTWTTSYYKLNKVELVGKSSVLGIVFPKLDSSLKTFTICVSAETVENIKTTHKPFIEVRNADDSINLNKSTGSSSSVITKILYQDVIKNLYLSAIAPGSHETTTDSTDGAVSSSNRIVLDDLPATPRHVKVGDKLTCTGVASSVHALVTKINPDGDNANEIQISVADTIGDAVAMTFTPPFNGMTPHYTDSTTGRANLKVESLSSLTLPFSISLTSIAGRSFKLNRKPTTEDLCAVKVVTFGSAALAIEGEDTSSDSLFYRWPVNNIAGLINGMSLDPSRKESVAGNTTVPAFITGYNTTKTLQRVSNSNKYYDDFEDYTLNDVSVDGVNSYNNPITAIDRNGRVTAQAGNIVFNVQQKDALKGDAAIKLIAQGAKAIEGSTGMSVTLSNVTVTAAGQETDTVFTTAVTTTSAVSNSTTIPVNEVQAVVAGATLRGIGVRGTTKPVVRSKSTVSGAGNIIASSAVTLEDEAVLNLDGASNVITIKGAINIKNMPITDTTLYFNVERFLTCL